jgi:hypothetical protein
VPEDADAILGLFASRKLPAARLGLVGGNTIDVTVAGESLRWPLAEIYADWHDAIANALRAETPATL